jgi:hypothetical protein
MANSIETIYNYQAGNKVISGHFPVYDNTISYETIQTSSINQLANIKAIKKNLLNESDPLPVLSPTSTEYDPVRFILKKDGIEYNLFR